MSDMGTFEALLASRQFAVTAELSPPDSADPEEVYSRARVFDGYVDAVYASDSRASNRHMSNAAVCVLLERHGYTTVMSISTRDRNRLALQSDVLGASALGISNLLCLGREDVQSLENEDANPVFDLDSTTLISILRTMRDDARFPDGSAISAPPRVFIGAAIDPFGDSRTECVEQLAAKIAAGAAFVQTRHCFDVARLEEFMSEVRDRGLHEKCSVLVGVGPIDSPRSARLMRRGSPGLHIPEQVIDRLEGADRPRHEGRRMCMELIQQIREIEGVAGVHVMAYRQEETVAEIIDASGVLSGRMPWNPASGADSTLKRASL